MSRAMIAAVLVGAVAATTTLDTEKHRDSKSALTMRKRQKRKARNKIARQSRRVNRRKA